MSDEPKPTKTIGEIANEAGLALWQSYCDLKMEREETRDQLAGGDALSLPIDYPTWRMAKDRMEELAIANALLKEGYTILNTVAMAAKFSDDKEGFNALLAWIDKVRPHVVGRAT